MIPETHADTSDSRPMTIGDKAIFAVALAFSIFQIISIAYSPLSSLVARSFHVGFLLLLAFLMFAPKGGRADGQLKIYDIVLGIVGFALAFYHMVFEGALIQRAGDPSTTDIVIGCAVVLLVFEAARRVMGFALPLICAGFLFYGLFGEYFPGLMQHRGFAFHQVVDQVFIGTEGIYGIPTFVSSTFIFLFILFGAFLERAGMIQLFNDIAMGSVGHAQGGPAKVSVVSSAMMGTVSGSGVANVVTTGQFTIPLMKRSGYSPAFAGAVEATASMGGQIMPPIMGAVAFIMAETLDKPYIEIVQAAVIPAILYFVTVFWMVHLEAGRKGLAGLDKATLPDPKAALMSRWPLLLPLVVLVTLLFSGYTPLFAGMIALALTSIIVLGTPISMLADKTSIRIVFWVLIGVLCAGFFKFGVDAVFAVIGALVAWNFVRKGGKSTLMLCVDSLAEGAKNAVGVGIPCALVGVIIAVMTLTGLATTVGQVVVAVAGHSLFLSLFLTMIMCLVLGMGIPTIPNYIITSSLVAPSLLDLGVPLIVSHMFVFYFGIMADLTPPVALAAFAASSIAKESGLKISMHCMRIAIAGFVVPFMAVYAPALMMQGGDYFATAYVFAKALLAVGLWGAATIGHLDRKLSWPERGVACLAAFSFVLALPISDEIGFGLMAVFIGYRVIARRREKQASS